MKSELSEEVAQFDLYQESVFFPLVSAIAIDKIMEFAKQGLMNEILM